MNLQPYGTQKPVGDEDLQQLAGLFAAQQLVTRKADASIVQESQKTLGVFREAIGASKAETQALMLENAALRERLATMESQKRESEALHRAEARAKDARHNQEVAALKETNRKQQRVFDAYEKIIQERVENEKWTSEHLDVTHFPPSVHEAIRQRYVETHAILLKQYERAKEGVFVELKTLYPTNWK